MSDSLILRTRPTVVEARQVTEDNRDDIARWCGGWTFGAGYLRWFSKHADRVLDAKVGDWVVRSAFGDFVRVSDSSLFAEYDRVNPAVTE